MSKSVKLVFLLNEYVKLYVKEKWAVTTYSVNMGLINNYILPVIGKTDVSSVNNHFVEKFYRTLSNMPAVDGANNKKAREMFLETQSLKYIRFSEAVFVRL